MPTLRKTRFSPSLSRAAVMRLLAATLLALAAGGPVAGQGVAQGAAGLLTIVVPFPAGGVTDLAARALADKLGPALGRTVVIENRPGGGSRIGTESVARAAPDGSTLLFTNTSYAILPVIDPSVRARADRSLAPVGLLASYGLTIVVANGVPAQTLPEFIAHARRNPGKLSYGSSGPGSGAHFAGEFFKALTGTYLVHIPYRSTSAALNDVAGGALDLTFDATARPYVDAGKVRALAVTAGQRDPRMPGVPTAAEAGLKDFVLSSWVGLLAPAGSPPAAIERLNAALNKVLADPGLRSRLQDLGLKPEGGSSERMQDEMRRDDALYRRIASEAKLRFE
jgi:tripartite-type tricarboxylate transporter receptor subunit TctC